MGNKTVRKAQVMLEFALAFIILLTLVIGGYNIWADLSGNFVEETVDYQDQRLASGQGDISIPGQDPIDVELPELDDETLQKIFEIEVCECIGDALKEEAIDLYIRQYELDIYVNTYEDVISSLEDSIEALEMAYDLIPWCSQCCECLITCYKWVGGSWFNPGSWESYDYWDECSGSALNPCTSCSTGYGYLECPGGLTPTCQDIRPNSGHSHVDQRQMIQDSIDQTQQELDDTQVSLDEVILEKDDVDTQIDALDIDCCF